MPESPLKTQINDAMKDAMRAREKQRLGTLRLMLSEIKKVEVDERIDPDDARITSILDKMVKQRRDSIKQFSEAGRDELAAQEQSEIEVIQEFLPQQLTEAEIDAIIKQAIADSSASSMQDMGKVMGCVKGQVVGKADMGQISQKVRAALS
ncbi:MAG: GatB/YqeY domain-containing protein [Gammaproteobacteria bacterium]|nr:GatB/YqeY domain-containing protein [Gammaproteobacteria bacterium]MCY4357649.1 GatB/YqeY domain-containing protein [Gammaproteobacteria bacterium]